MIDVKPDWGICSGLFLRSNELGFEGSIAVQVHGGKNWPVGAKCRWKNIRVRPLG